MLVKLFLLFTVFFVIIFVLRAQGIFTLADTQCTTVHNTTSSPPDDPKTAMDFFEQGNYHYDIGKCKDAILDYSRSIELNPNYPEAYNNRAYTFMRMQDYESALPDLDKAIELKPDYPQALMNRGDIHNFSYQIDRKSAIADYDKVISLGAIHDTSVCGHKAMAESNNLIPLAFLRISLKVTCK